METCDDCHAQYPGPAYYTFEADGCRITETVNGVETEIPHDCTENMCPDCAGPYLEPDMSGDPRRPPVIQRYVLVQQGDPIGGDMGIKLCLGPDVRLIEDIRVGKFITPTHPAPQPIRIRIVEADRDLSRELKEWVEKPSSNLLAHKEVT